MTDSNPATATRSDPPRRRSLTPPSLELVTMAPDGKISFTGKGTVALVVALVLTGGGGTFLANWLGNLGIASSEAVDEVATSQAAYETMDDRRHSTVVERLDGHDRQLEGITVTIGEVQEVQHWQAADQAAERIAQEAPKPQRRAAYKRLFKANLQRLKAKKLPCSNLGCSN